MLKPLRGRFAFLTPCWGLPQTQLTLKSKINYKGLHVGEYKQVKVNLDLETHKSLEQEAVSMNMNLAEYFRYKIGVEFSAKSRFRKNRVQDNSKKMNPEIIYFLSQISKEMKIIFQELEVGKTDTRLILTSLLEIRDLLKAFEIES